MEIPMDECPMPEPFGARIGLTLSVARLFFLGFVTRVMFAPLMPPIEEDLGIRHAQAGSHRSHSHFFLVLGRYDDQAGC